MFRFCLIGFGRWGETYYRTISRLNFCTIDCIVSNKSGENHSIEVNVPFFKNINDVINQRKVDGFIIASPPSTHYYLAKICLESGYPVIVEKPFTESYDQAYLLTEIAKKKNTLCMVGYQHLFSKNHLALKKIIHSFVDNLVIYSEGLSNGPFRTDVTVFRDWGSHEIAMAIDLFNEIPLNYSIKKISGNIKDHARGIFLMELEFSSNRKYNSIFGNISEVKRRSIIATYKGGWAYINGLDHGGIAIMKNGLIVNPKSILISEPMPVDLLLIDFIKKLKSKESKNESLALPLTVAYLLDKIESKIFEGDVNV